LNGKRVPEHEVPVPPNSRGFAAIGQALSKSPFIREEVNGVVSALGEASIDISALHNHFLNESTRVMIMHVDGMGGRPGEACRGSQECPIPDQHSPSVADRGSIGASCH
jgi:hypothetical protein